MELQKKVLDYIKSNGIKKGYIAEQIGISQTEFSLWLHGKTYINYDIEQKLISLINSK
ncbi:MAG: hypothetical protein VB095_07565 [Anaerovorax sp.]|nr:hypothetical protein [Anaerovorax sp.]